VPSPDPTHCLDLRQLMEEKASDPAAWPEPFRREPGNLLSLIEITTGHFVEARSSPAVVASAQQAAL